MIAAIGGFLGGRVVVWGGSVIAKGFAIKVVLPVCTAIVGGAFAAGCATVKVIQKMRK